MHDVNVKPEPDTKGQARKPSLPQSSAAPPHHRHSVYGYIGHEPGGGGKDDYDEIDQIYDYVRGFAPLPKSAKGWQYIAESGHEAGDKKEPIYQKLSVPQPENAENKPPEPPPIDTIPGRRVSVAEPASPPPPLTPPFSPPWTSPAHAAPPPPATMMTPLGPNGQLIGIVPPPHLVMERPVSADPGPPCHAPAKFEKAHESKKRQRPKTADPGKLTEGLLDAKETANPRYVKATNKQNSTKHKFFRSRVKEKEAVSGPAPAPAPLCNLSSNTFYKESRHPSHPAQPSFFNLRYKSLTNLAHQVNKYLYLKEKKILENQGKYLSNFVFDPAVLQEYDTLDSSNSGGKTSFDSAGSRNVPEKRSRKLERPKSLTNLVWDFRSGGGTLMQRSNSKPSIILGPGSQDRKMVEAGGFSKRRFSKDYSPGGMGKKMGSNKMATLYL